jgi:hypothetical protein
MNRITSLLALGALVVAGAFAGTAAQASASNVNVNFKVANGDASTSTIRTGQSSGISGLITPAAAILPGNSDPASGSAFFSAPMPLSVGSYVEGWVKYANAGDMSLNQCTFNIRVTRVSTLSLRLHFSITESPTDCSVPADVTNSDGQFTSTTYVLTWKT